MSATVITKAITHIRLPLQANSGKIAALNAVATEYMALCQQYVTYFCQNQPLQQYQKPDKFSPTQFPSSLSQRWQRVAIQQAAGIARSWLSNRENAYLVYLEELTEYHKQQPKEIATTENDQSKRLREPIWRDWNIPNLKATSIQANCNVVQTLKPDAKAVIALEAATNSSHYDYWLRISTLDKRKPLYLPVKLAEYHKEQLAKHKPNTSVCLNWRESDGSWWLTLTIDETIETIADTDAPVVGVDVGIKSFITTATGKQYGTFSGKLANRHKLDREKRRRKAKLRSCLKKKGVTRLPSLTNKRLARYVRQEINRAVNLFFLDHQGYQVAYENLNVASMRFKARQMNAYLYASNLGHLPKQLEWGARKRGVKATWVKAAYSSQECSQCHYVDSDNRPDQRTFRCLVCDYTTHADYNAAVNIRARLGDMELSECNDREQVRSLLASRHSAWKLQQTSKEKQLVVVQLPVQLPEFVYRGSTDVG
jgi:hypothetical protein